MERNTRRALAEDGLLRLSGEDQGGVRRARTLLRRRHAVAEEGDDGRGGQGKPREGVLKTCASGRTNSGRIPRIPDDVAAADCRNLPSRDRLVIDVSGHNRTRMDWLIWLESLPSSVWVRESGSLWSYPTVLFLHTVGLAFAVGMSAVISLRVLGAAADMPLPALEPFYRVLWIGFWVNAASGVASSSLTPRPS